LISSKYRRKSTTFRRGALLGLLVAGSCALSANVLAGQQSLGLTPSQASGPNAQSFQGSVTVGQATGQPIDLGLDDAMARGLKNNLGVILSGTQTAAARGQRLSQLQSLLPSVDGSIKDTVLQTDLPAEGLRFPGFPKIIGPYGYQDFRATLN